MTDEIAGWHARLPERAGHGIAAALRQTLDAGVRWKRMNSNPAKLAGRNPKPPVRTVRAFTGAEVDAIALELSAIYRPMPALAAATGLRPEEWQALERRDVDRGGASSTSAAPSRLARWWSWPTRAQAAGRCRCRPGRWQRSTRYRHRSVRGCCSRLLRAGC
jgi:integrase